MEWSDGQCAQKNLDDPVPQEAIELVGYIPQNYIETICNEIQSSEGRFDKELKSVIFSHVEDASRLGSQSLDELLGQLTEQTSARMKQLRDDLTRINQKIVELQQRGSPEAQQLLLNLYDQKKHELEVHKKNKPKQVTKPETDPQQRKETKGIAQQIEAEQRRHKQLAADLKKLEGTNRDALVKTATADRILGRIKNFQTQYEGFIAESELDCSRLSLNPRKLVTIQVETAAIDEIRESAQKTALQATEAKEKNRQESAALKKSTAELTAKMDAPSMRYQKYLQQLQEWEERGEEITGADHNPGSVVFFERQIKDFADIPNQLKASNAEREGKTREIFHEIEQLVSTHKSLYGPVQKFAERHDLKGKFNFQFEASIVCKDAGEILLSKINQSRRGSFSGAEEGRRALNNLVSTADFNTADGALAFVGILMNHLSARPLTDQLKKGYKEENILDDIFSLRYLQPRYMIRWFGKDIEELSPGERGALLLVFYLLIDRRDIPLVIDQPEENLDNQTVFDLLVPCIKEARKRRQVIIVTHNPNLAVVCDADQVIHSNIDKAARNKVTYTAGSLENPKNNKLTVDVLEGTMPAFEHRDSKYQD